MNYTFYKMIRMPAEKQVLMLFGDYADDYEVMVPYSVLKMVGYLVDVACPGKIEGDFVRTAVHYISEADWSLMISGKPVNYSESLGHPFRLANKFDWENFEETLNNYEGLIIPGGRSPEYLSDLPEVQKLVHHFMLQNKPIGAICHGIQILTHSDAAFEDLKYLEGKIVFPYPSLILECKSLGAIVNQDYAADAAITQDKLVTAPSWLALPEFMNQFLNLLNFEFKTK